MSIRLILQISILKNSKKRKGQWLTITIRSNSTTRSLAGNTSLATRLITRLSEDLPIRDAEEEDEDEEGTRTVARLRLLHPCRLHQANTFEVGPRRSSFPLQTPYPYSHLPFQ